MELRRIVINKEIIIQKLSSNKNITKEIQNMTKRIVQLIKVKNNLSAKVLQNVKIHQKKTSIKKKRLSRLTKTKITSTNN